MNTIPESKTCETCGRLFLKTKNVPQSQWVNRRFCTRDCWTKTIVGSSSTRPSEAELRTLYETERLTTREIGLRFGVPHISVRRWLLYHGITSRHGGRGLENRGVTAPSRDELVQMVHVDHLSYDQIAAKYDVDHSAIMHWLKKHDIERPKIGVTRTKGKTLCLPDKKTLQDLIENGISLKRVGIKYGVSEIVIASRCKQYGIPIKPGGYNNGIRYECISGLMVRSTYEREVANWLIMHSITFVYEPKLPFGGSFLADFLAKDWYIEIWGVTNSARYDAQKARKQDLYVAYQLPLIDIEPEHFQLKKVDQILRRYLIPGEPQRLLPGF